MPHNPSPNNSTNWGLCKTPPTWCIFPICIFFFSFFVFINNQVVAFRRICSWVLYSSLYSILFPLVYMPKLLSSELFSWMILCTSKAISFLVKLSDSHRLWGFGVLWSNDLFDHFKRNEFLVIFYLPRISSLSFLYMLQEINGRHGTKGWFWLALKPHRCTGWGTAGYYCLKEKYSMSGLIRLSAVQRLTQPLPLKAMLLCPLVAKTRIPCTVKAEAARRAVLRQGQWQSKEQSSVHRALSFVERGWDVCSCRFAWFREIMAGVSRKVQNDPWSREGWKGKAW